MLRRYPLFGGLVLFGLLSIIQSAHAQVAMGVSTSRAEPGTFRGTGRGGRRLRAESWHTSDALLTGRIGRGSGLRSISGKTRRLRQEGRILHWTMRART
jgi:hypothetical protein